MSPSPTKSSSQSVSLSKSNVQRLEEYFFDKMSKSRTPGASIALVKGTDTVYARGFGSRDVENGKPATPNTIFGIGSVTKSFTALSVMMLQDQGKLDINHPVEKYVPGFGLSDRNNQVRIHHLLSHSSGMPALGVAEILIERSLGKDSSGIPMGSLDDMLTHINQAAGERMAPPGKRYFYWNEGYTLLGRIIEIASGESYPDYVTNHILKPLGMSRATFSRSILQTDNDAMTPYTQNKDGKYVATQFPSHPLVDAPGGLLVSMSELANYIKMYINDGKFGDFVVPSPLLKELCKGKINTGRAGGMGEMWYCYGWARSTDFLGKELIWHTGGIDVSVAFAGFLPEKKVGVVLAANGSSFPTFQVGAYALALLAGEEPNRLSMISKENALERLVGEYENYKGLSKVTVSRAGYYLNLTMRGEGSEQTLPVFEDQGKYYLVAGPDKMEIEFLDRGGGKMDLVIERNVFHKTGKLSKR